MKLSRPFTLLKPSTLAALAAPLLALVPCPLSPASAACKVKCCIVAVVSDVVAVPVAVPVGVPVAPYAPYYYSYQQIAQAPVACDTDAIAAAVVQRLKDDGKDEGGRMKDEIKPSSSTFQPSSLSLHPSSIVVQKCATCHSQGLATSKSIAFEQFNPAGALTCEQRLAAARAVLSEKMPKGAKLSADEAGQVLTELIGK